MGNLRDAVGMKKLGIHVAAEIETKLRGQGLGHYPLELPLNQDESVRLYVLGSQVDELITAVLDVSPEKDVLLQQRSGGDASARAESILAQVKDLIDGSV